MIIPKVKKGFVVKDWIFPSLAFLMFMYGAVFVVLYIYNYKTSNISAFADTNTSHSNERGIDSFLKDISNSFK